MHLGPYPRHFIGLSIPWYSSSVAKGNRPFSVGSGLHAAQAIPGLANASVPGWSTGREKAKDPEM
jgi:hypothetical protein